MAALSRCLNNGIGVAYGCFSPICVLLVFDLSDTVKMYIIKWDKYTCILFTRSWLPKLFGTATHFSSFVMCHDPEILVSTKSG